VEFIIIISAIAILLGGIYLSKRFSSLYRQRMTKKQLETELTELHNLVLVLRENIEGIEYAIFEELGILRNEQNYYGYLDLVTRIAQDVYDVSLESDDKVLMSLCLSILQKAELVATLATEQANSTKSKGKN
jgi:hypothetical protein